MKPLVTRRLSLEPLTRTHAAEMFAALSDPALYRYVDEEPPASVETLAQRYSRLESRRSGDGAQHWLNWVVRVAMTGHAVGYVQATVMLDGSAFIAYVIAPSVQGRGFGREATDAMMGELGSTYGATRFLANIDRHNEPSIRLVESLGFAEIEGTESPADRLFERRTGQAVESSVQ